MWPQLLFTSPRRPCTARPLRSYIVLRRFTPHQWLSSVDIIIIARIFHTITVTGIIIMATAIAGTERELNID